MSSYSTNNVKRSQAMFKKERTAQREELIARRIEGHDRERNTTMYRTIENTIVDDKLKVYKSKRQQFDEEISELLKEKTKIMRKRRNKKEKMKLLKQNTKAVIRFMVMALNDTVKEYQKQYFHNDLYRLQSLKKAMKAESKTPSNRKSKALLDGLKRFYESPFKDDKCFMLKYVMQRTRDSIDESEELVNSLFFERIFRLIN